MEPRRGFRVTRLRMPPISNRAEDGIVPCRGSGRNSRSSGLHPSIVEEAETVATGARRSNPPGARPVLRRPVTPVAAPALPTSQARGASVCVCKRTVRSGISVHATGRLLRQSQARAGCCGPPLWRLGDALGGLEGVLLAPGSAGSLIPARAEVQTLRAANARAEPRLLARRLDTCRELRVGARPSFALGDRTIDLDLPARRAYGRGCHRCPVASLRTHRR